MGHIWLIYGLYMGYLRERTIVAPLQRLYKILVLLVIDNKG
jgi:hypothetical protein